MAIDKQRLINTVYNWTKTNSPYDTGNLREKGIFGPYSNGLEDYFVVGGDAAVYGPMLNNLPVITTRAGSQYRNKHYKWVENRVLEGLALAGAKVVESGMELI